jgi:DNA-binding GntR family transcriptional regulator
VAKTDLSKKAYDYLFEHIVRNDYAPGTPIVEKDICDLLDISRTPVREALRRLEVEGLIVKIKDVGTIVRDITYDDITEIFEIRKLFELFALKRAVKNISDEEVRSLEDQLQKLGNSSENQDYYIVDRRIHSTIMKYCSNTRMVNYLKTINAQLEILRRVSAINPKRLSHSKEEHLAIVRAIGNRDYDQASQNLSYHLDEVRNSVIEAFRHMKASHYT